MTTPVLFTALALAAALCGCSPSAAFRDVRLTDVDGIEYAVRPVRSGYQAFRNDASQWVKIDPAEYGRNVRAIAQVTGCDVDMTSLQHSLGSTLAVVDCDS